VKLPLRVTSLIVLTVALLATAAAGWGTYTVVHDQEHRLLKERAGELVLLLSNSLQGIQSTISAQGGILNATGNSVSAYEQSARAAVTADPGKPTFAWLRRNADGSGYVVLGAAGDALHRGEVVNDERARSFDQAMTNAELVATPIVGSGRNLGFALGPPAAPPGTVLYRQTSLGPVQAPRSASTAPYAELQATVYASTSPDPTRVLVTTKQKLPLTGDVRNERLGVGQIHWLLSVSARHPLVGGVAANAWWVAVLVGVFGSILLAFVVETSRRRRDAALALYASEHQVAETLQRSLLPSLPSIPGLEFAARYLAGSTGQEVGGDWFDVFPVRGGGIAITVGDVIGHDLAAASAMAQIRAAVRAYAVDGDEPRSVINRLDGLVDALGLTQLATVIYGVLAPAAPDGSRVLTYTNAGHLAPLLRSPSGRVTAVEGGDSILLGAPIVVDHAQTQLLLEPGSTLVLFTDGLVEVPGRPLDEGVDQLVTALADPAVTDLDTLCQRVLATTSDRELRDDVALRVIRLVPAPTMRDDSPLVADVHVE
jgi:hypothetical protein